MGGVVIVLATVLGYFVGEAVHPGLAQRPRRCCCSSCSSGCGLVGFLDDFIKVAKQRSLGLRSKAKMIGQTVVAVVFGVLSLSPALEDERGQTPASHHISFIRDFDSWALPTVDRDLPDLADRRRHLQRGEPHRRPGRPGHRRLGDGLRRLHAGEHLAEQPVVRPGGLDQPALCYEVRDPLDLAVIAAAITGACFGFLWWNASPAAIFMGDTGSLALGGALAGLRDPDPHRAAARRSSAACSWSRPCR